MKDLKIIIVDDNMQFREGLKFYIETILHHKVIGEAKNGIEFLNTHKHKNADIILMDIAMPEKNGIETSQEFLQFHNTQKIIAITSYEEKTYLNELIETGIKGCVFKKDIYEHLQMAINRVMMNELYFPKNIPLK